MRIETNIMNTIKLSEFYCNEKINQQIENYETDVKNILDNTNTKINSENSDWTTFDILHLQVPWNYQKFNKPERKLYQVNKSQENKDLYYSDMIWYYKGWNENLWKVIQIAEKYWIGSYRKMVRTREEAKQNNMIRNEYNVYFKQQLDHLVDRHRKNENNIKRLEKDNPHL